MIKAKNLRLTNVVHFKDAALEIKRGLYVVRGLNKSSKNKNQNNGAGKSLLFSPIANIFVGSPPLNSKKKNKADLLQKDSCGQIEFITHDKRHIEVHQYVGKYDIFEDGKDLQITTATKAEKQIREYFPLNEQEFYSTVYLTTMPHPFQVASPNDRLKFISDLFRLHDYDVLKKHFTLKLRAIKDCETEHRILLTEYAKTEQQLKRLVWNEDKQHELDEYRAQLEEISAKIKGIQEELLRYSKMGIVHQQYSSLLDKLKAVGKISDPKKRLVKLNEIHDQCEAFSEYEREFDTYKRNSSNLTKRLDTIKCEFSVDEARILYENTEQEFEDLRTKLEVLDEQASEYEAIVTKQDALKRQLKAFDFDILDKESITQRKYEAQSLSSLSKLLDDDCDGTVTCPTCKSDFEASNLKRIVKKAQAEFDFCVQQLTAIKCKSEYEALVVPKYDEIKHNALRAEFKQLAKFTKICETQYEEAKEKETLTKALAQIKKPKLVLDPEYDIQDIEAKIKDCEKHIRIQDEIDELLATHNVEDDYDPGIENTLQRKFDKLSNTLNKVHEKINLLDNSKAEYMLLKANLRDIDQKLANLSSEIEGRKVTEALVAAYGPKGIKINAINNICANLEANFNSMAKLIYNEDFNFELAVDGSGIDVICHKPKGYMSDVRTLSGAESDCFRLLFLTSMLPMMPEDRRTNFVVLDEPDSHMDQVSRDKFIHDFVPHLCEIVPSVYILTPNDDFYPSATNLLVTKEKGKSRLSLDTRP